MRTNPKRPCFPEKAGRRRGSPLFEARPTGCGEIYLTKGRSLKSGMKTFLFELCAVSLEAARAGQYGGADRIELCAELEIGGVTPDFDLARTIATNLSIPVNVLIRPRGGDFVYSASEFLLMCRQIELARAAGAHGVVFGILHPDGRVDVERTRTLVNLARPMNVTFHRAFDETPDLAEALEAVIETGADSLLTSGGAPDVLSGAESIERLCRQAGDRIQIMAGGGLRLATLCEVVRRTGATAFHGSLPHTGGAPSTKASSKRLEADVREVVRVLRESVALQAAAL